VTLYRVVSSAAAAAAVSFPYSWHLAGSACREPADGRPAAIADPDLGLDEHVGPVEIGGRDGLADLALVAVGGGGVDVAVAANQG